VRWRKKTSSRGNLGIISISRGGHHPGKGKSTSKKKKKTSEKKGRRTTAGDRAVLDKAQKPRPARHGGPNILGTPSRRNNEEEGTMWTAMKGFHS